MILLKSIFQVLYYSSFSTPPKKALDMSVLSGISTNILAAAFATGGMVEISPISNLGIGRGSIQFFFICSLGLLEVRLIAMVSDTVNTCKYARRAVLTVPVPSLRLRGILSIIPNAIKPSSHQPQF